MKNTSHKGQTLVEMLIALGILVMLLSSAVALVSSTLHNAQAVTSETQATKYAQEGMEIVHQIRDTNYVGFRKYSGTYCLGQNQTTLGSAVVSCTSANVGNFIRSVQIQQNGCGNTIAKISVIVAWQDSKCSGNTYCQNVPLVSCLTTVNPIPAP